MDRKVEDAGPAIEKIVREVWELAELSHKEVDSARLLMDVLEENGFATTSEGTAGVPTAFVAGWDSGRWSLGTLWRGYRAEVWGLEEFQPTFTRTTDGWPEKEAC